MSINLLEMHNFPNGLAIKWDDENESFIEYEKLRSLCPCAHCSGETDVFGNVYKGPDESLPEQAFKLINIIKVGHYAVRITWGDGHNTGLYSYNYLKKLGN
tara:strand:+ start:290 stop:592 length:303 start_codon:yes stop_codon:yes gene_type:complete